MITIYDICVATSVSTMTLGVALTIVLRFLPRSSKMTLLTPKQKQDIHDQEVDLEYAKLAAAFARDVSDSPTLTEREAWLVKLIAEMRVKA